MNHAGTPSTTAKGQPSQWWTIAVLLVILSVALVTLAMNGSTLSPSARPPAHPTTVDPAPPDPSVPPDPVFGPAPPTRLTIPAIGVNTKLLRLGLNEDRSVQVPSPEKADQAGWYELGTEPGRQGSAVILGHVDSLTGPAVFYRLKALQPGTRFTVNRSDHTIATFTVLRVDTYANQNFPAGKVYAPRTKKSLLNLVTCGGNYDRSKGGYQSNVVAFSQLVTISPSLRSRRSGLPVRHGRQFTHSSG